MPFVYLSSLLFDRDVYLKIYCVEHLTCRNNHVHCMRVGIYYRRIS